MAEHTGVFTWVISKVKGAKIVSKSLVSYIINPLTGVNYQLSDLATNDLVTKGMLVSAVNTPPVTLNFNIASFPVVIPTFSVTYSNYGPRPTIIIREFYNDIDTGNACIRQRENIWFYNTVTDELKIDAAPFDGEITFKV